MSDMAIILSVPKAPKRWSGILKGLSHERVWINSVENLLSSFCSRDLSTGLSDKLISLDGLFKNIIYILYILSLNHLTCLYQNPTFFILFISHFFLPYFYFSSVQCFLGECRFFPVRVKLYFFLLARRYFLHG